MDVRAVVKGESKLKVSLHLPNAANAVANHLATLPIGSLTGLRGVYITGSNVWKPVFGLEPDADSDIDIMVTENRNDTVYEQRDAVRRVLGITEPPIADDTGSMIMDRPSSQMPGLKYQLPGGRVVDIFGVTTVVEGLADYPAESHGSARVAWSCEHGCLVMLPNPTAVL